MEERNRIETQMAVEGFGDSEFVAEVDATLEDDLHRIHSMSEIERDKFKIRLDRARQLGLDPMRVRKASRILQSIRVEGLFP
jgi:hypothetical protein